MVTTKLWTIEELEREGAPEGRWELIDGELVEMNPSSSHSSKIGAQFVRHLGNFAAPRGLGAVFGADGGFAPFPGRPTVRVPDAAFVRAERLPPPDDLGFYRLAPDLVVEVVSPSDRMTDVTAKVMMWLEAGVRLVWVAEPDHRRITVYEPDCAPRRLGEGDDLDGGDILPGFLQPVGVFFA